MDLQVASQALPLGLVPASPPHRRRLQDRLNPRTRESQAKALPTSQSTRFHHRKAQALAALVRALPVRLEVSPQDQRLPAAAAVLPQKENQLSDHLAQALLAGFKFCLTCKSPAWVSILLPIVY